MFSTRIVTTDHYLTAPIQDLDVCYNDYRGCDVYKVPVVRVYGATPTGQKTCMHVHGVFPYLYIPYDGGEPVDRYLRQLTCSIDKALNVALGRASSNFQHVYKVVLVSGSPFYGYHSDTQTFVKIYLYNPLMVKKVADLLLGGAVMNKVYQPYEAHIPYLLQMFIDYNLYGMNMLNVAAVKFRRPANKTDNGNNDDDTARRCHSNRSTPRDSFSSLDDSLLGSSNSPSLQAWDVHNIPSDLWLDDAVVRQSTCQLEVDVVAADILNRLEVGDNVGSNPGLAALWEDEKRRRGDELNDTIDLEPPASPDRGSIAWTPAEAALQERLNEIIEELQPYMGDSTDEESDLTPTGQGGPNDSQIFQTTPCSQVDLHLSRQVSDVSVDTVIMDSDEEEEKAVINERSILRVVSSSQSFRLDTDDLDNSQVLSQDRSLAQLLAALAGTEGDSPVANQIASQMSAMEEQDSILTQVSPGNHHHHDDDDNDMSQSLLADDDAQPAQSGDPGDVFDLCGMDQSWNSSQWLDLPASQGQGQGHTGQGRPVAGTVTPVEVITTVPESDSDEEWGDSLPQVDGPADTSRTRSGRRSGSLSMKASAPAGHDGDQPGGSSCLTVRLDLTRATSASFSREVPVSTDVTPAKLARGSSANSTPTRGQQVTRPDGRGRVAKVSPVSAGAASAANPSCSLDLRNVMTIAAFKEVNRIVDPEVDSGQVVVDPGEVGETSSMSGNSLVRTMARCAEDASDEPTAMEKITQMVSSGDEDDDDEDEDWNLFYWSKAKNLHSDVMITLSDDDSEGLVDPATLNKPPEMIALSDRDSEDDRGVSPDAITLSDTETNGTYWNSQGGNPRDEVTISDSDEEADVMVRRPRMVQRFVEGGDVGGGTVRIAPPRRAQRFVEGVDVGGDMIRITPSSRTQRVLTVREHLARREIPNLSTLSGDADTEQVPQLDGSGLASDDDDDADTIPQLDGPTDSKSRGRRLGMRGAATQSPQQKDGDSSALPLGSFSIKAQTFEPSKRKSRPVGEKGCVNGGVIKGASADHHNKGAKKERSERDQVPSKQLKMKFDLRSTSGSFSNESKESKEKSLEKHSTSGKSDKSSSSKSQQAPGTRKLHKSPAPDKPRKKATSEKSSPPLKSPKSSDPRKPDKVPAPSKSHKTPSMSKSHKASLQDENLPTEAGKQEEESKHSMETKEKGTPFSNRSHAGKLDKKSQKSKSESQPHQHEVSKSHHKPKKLPTTRGAVADLRNVTPAKQSLNLGGATFVENKPSKSAPEGQSSKVAKSAAAKSKSGKANKPVSVDESGKPQSGKGKVHRKSGRTSESQADSAAVTAEQTPLTGTGDQSDKALAAKSNAQHQAEEMTELQPEQEGLTPEAAQKDDPKEPDEEGASETSISAAPPVNSSQEFETPKKKRTITGGFRAEHLVIKPGQLVLTKTCRPGKIKPPVVASSHKIDMRCMMTASQSLPARPMASTKAKMKDWAAAMTSMDSQVYIKGKLKTPPVTSPTLVTFPGNVHPPIAAMMEEVESPASGLKTYIPPPGIRRPSFIDPGMIKGEEESKKPALRVYRKHVSGVVKEEDDDEEKVNTSEVDLEMPKLDLETEMCTMDPDTPFPMGEVDVIVEIREEETDETQVESIAATAEINQEQTDVTHIVEMSSENPAALESVEIIVQDGDADVPVTFELVPMKPLPIKPSTAEASTEDVCSPQKQQEHGKAGVRMNSKGEGGTLSTSTGKNRNPRYTQLEDGKDYIQYMPGQTPLNRGQMQSNPGHDESTLKLESNTAAGDHRRHEKSLLEDPELRRPSVELIAEESSSPDRSNIFAVVTPDVAGGKADKKMKKKKVKGDSEKALDKESAAKVAKGLIGFRKTFLSGKSQVELKKIQEKLNKTPGSKKMPVVLDDDDACEGGLSKSPETSKEGFLPKSLIDEQDSLRKPLTEKELLANLKIRKRRRRRRHSSRSSRGQHLTGSEKDTSDIEDPDDYIIRGRRDSDSSAHSDDSLELKPHVGAVQKTYEKPSYRVGVNFGKDTPFTDKPFDDMMRQRDGRSSGGEADIETASDVPDLEASKPASKVNKLTLKKKTLESKGPEDQAESVYTILKEPVVGDATKETSSKEVTAEKQQTKFRGTIRRPSRVPRRKCVSADRIKFLSNSPVKYYHSRRRDAVSSDSDSEGEFPGEQSLVQVLREEQEEHDFDQLGCESIVLGMMDAAEIDELQRQVKREMAHKRSEHIMPLVMQKSKAEIEKEYQVVKQKLMEESANEPPMPEYVDSDLEQLDSDSDNSPSEAGSRRSSHEPRVGADQLEPLSRATAPKSGGPLKFSDVSSDEEMPKLEPAVGADTDQQEHKEKKGDAEAHAKDETFVIISQEEADAAEPDGVKDEIVVIDLDAMAAAREQEDERLKILQENTEAQIRPQTSESTEAQVKPATMSSESTDQSASANRRTEKSTKSEETKPVAVHKDIELLKSAKTSSRRSSVDMATDKGDMTEVDFSLLEMDTHNDGQVEGLQEGEMDTHRQLHTPPIVFDSGQDQDEELMVTPTKTDEKQPGAEPDEEHELLAPVLSREQVYSCAEESAGKPRRHASSDQDDQGSHSMLGSDTDGSQGGSSSELYRQQLKKRKRYEQSDHYRFRDKRVHTDYVKSALSKPTQPAPPGPSSRSASSSPTRKSRVKPHTSQVAEDVRRPVKPHTSQVAEDVRRPGSSSADEECSKPKKQKTERSPSPKKKVPPEQPSAQPQPQSVAQSIAKPPTQMPQLELPRCVVILQRLQMTGATVKLFRSKKRKLSTDEDSGAEDTSFMTDVISENQEDPLWEAQRQRLADMARPQTAKRQKGPPKRLQDYVIPPGTLPNSPKKPTPKKKIRDPFVRGSTAKRSKKKTEKKKKTFLDKLSLLHQYTLESLSSVTETGSVHSEGSSKVESGTNSPVTVKQSPTETTERATYDKDVSGDHKAEYDDVMYKLALLSPPDDEQTERSPPKPTSPTHTKDGDTDSQPNNPARHDDSVTKQAPNQHTQGEPSTSVEESSSSGKKSPDLNHVSDKSSSKDGRPYTVKTAVVRISSEGQSPTVDKGSPALLGNSGPCSPTDDSGSPALLGNSGPCSPRGMSTPPPDLSAYTPPPDLGPPQICTTLQGDEPTIADISPPKLHQSAPSNPSCVQPRALSMSVIPADTRPSLASADNELMSSGAEGLLALASAFSSGENTVPETQGSSESKQKEGRKLTGDSKAEILAAVDLIPIVKPEVEQRSEKRTDEPIRSSMSEPEDVPISDVRRSCDSADEAKISDGDVDIYEDMDMDSTKVEGSKVDLKVAIMEEYMVDDSYSPIDLSHSSRHRGGSSGRGKAVTVATGYHVERIEEAPRSPSPPQLLPSSLRQSTKASKSASTSPESPPQFTSPASPSPQSPSPQSPSPQSPSPQSPSPQSPSPQSPPGPRSPSPIRSPDPHRVHQILQVPVGRMPAVIPLDMQVAVGRVPAVIPLDIDDPEVHEEVEMARRAKLRRILGSPRGVRHHRVRADQSAATGDPRQRDVTRPGRAPPGQDTQDGRDRPGNTPQDTQPASSSQHHTAGGGQPGRDAPTLSSMSGPRSVIQPLVAPPSRLSVLQHSVRHGLGEYQAQDAYCSNPSDVPDRPR